MDANDPDMSQSQAQDQSQSQRSSVRKKELSLKHGVTMQVTACGPIDQTDVLKLKMEWTVPNRNIFSKEIVLSCEDASCRKAKDIIWKKLGGPVFLNSDDQSRDFPRFLEMSMDRFEAEKHAAGLAASVKPIKEFNSVQLLDIENPGSRLPLVYLIAGKLEIFLLGGDSPDWARKLTEEEIDGLPYEICWTGPDTHYEVNSRKTTELVFKIISKINMAQDERFQSFPLFSLCSSLATYLYPIKMKTIKTFVSTMTISGAGYSTGKSLMYEICMLALYGKRLNNTVPNTIPQLYDMLASGIPIYVREWSDDLWKIWIEAIKATWEANGKTVNKIKKVPATAMLVSANLTVADVEKKLAGPVRSKLCLLYTGDKKLEHENLSELCDEVIAMAEQINECLPSLLGLGVLSMMTRVSTAQTASYNGELRNDNDERQSQVLYEYDEVHSHLASKGREHNLELPPLFQKDFVDHGCVTGQYRSAKDTQADLDTFLEFIEQSDLYEILAPASSGMQKGFKVNHNDPRIPSKVKAALSRCTQSFTTKEELRTVRKRFLDISKLDPDVSKKLELKAFDSSNTYQNMLVRRIEKNQRLDRELAKNFQTFCGGLNKRKLTDSDSNESDVVGDKVKTSSECQAIGVNDNSDSESGMDKVQSQTTCLVLGCPSYLRLFATEQYYKRHIKTDIHVKAERLLEPPPVKRARKPKKFIE